MQWVDHNKKYFPVRFLESVLEELGYHEEILIPGGGIHYVKQDEAKRPHLPSPLSLSYPAIGLDGTLWYSKEYLFELFDRLSNIDPTDGVLIRAIRKLDA
jgi:hypothetical protein